MLVLYVAKLLILLFVSSLPLPLLHQNPDLVCHCVAALKVLRLTTQTSLHKEELCWLVFNGKQYSFEWLSHVDV